MFLVAFPKIAKSDYYLRHVYLSQSVRWNNSTPTGRNFIKYDIWGSFFENLSRNFI